MKGLVVFLLLWALVFEATEPRYPKISPAASAPTHVVSKQAHIDITTKKVIHLFGEVTRYSIDRALLEEHLTESIPGDRVVLIDSPGGSVQAGQLLIDSLMLEKKRGMRIVCVAIDNAHSMAFNTLSFCDVRLATKGTRMVVHKVAFESLPIRGTARNLRMLANEADRVDEPYARQNAKMMHLKRKDYDKYADRETNWSVETLLARGYLNGVAVVTK
jgi:ATP-dependent protease ClpP protease subunit